MAVELGKFLKNPDYAALTNEEENTAFLSQAVKLQDQLATLLDDVRESGQVFESMRDLRIYLSSFLGLVSNYVKPDLELRLRIQKEEGDLPDAAMVFLDLVAKRLPGAVLGTITALYHDERELEWDEEAS